MSRKNKPLPIFENVAITGIAAEGRAVARVGEMVVFGALRRARRCGRHTGYAQKNKYCEGLAVKFHEYSSDRTEPFCKYFGICGGCRWQNLDYREQLKWKQKIVEDALQRIAKVDLPPILPIIGSNATKEYRNKLEFGFSNKRWLTKEEIAADVTYDNMNAVGFHVPGAFDKIIDIDECLLMDNIQNELRNDIRRYATDNGLSFFDIRKQEGLLRNIMSKKQCHW